MALRVYPEADTLSKLILQSYIEKIFTPLAEMGHLRPPEMFFSRYILVKEFYGGSCLAMFRPVLGLCGVISPSLMRVLGNHFHYF